MSTYTIPYVTTRTPRGERTVDLYSRLLEDRIVYLGTEIDDGVANALIAQLLHLESDNPDLPINLYLNSPGGSITAMLAVYDAMQYVAAPVETTCVGQAAWTAAVLLAGGEPGRRTILPHGRVVLHQPATQGRGTIPDLILEAEEIARVRTLLEEILSRHTGRSAEQVRSDTDRDLVLTPEALLQDGHHSTQDVTFEGEKILIVDDDIRNVFALTSVLEQHGCTVFNAENGRTGLEALERTEDVALVLMDVMMPEMDGYATMAAIREIERYRNLPIIALTAKAMRGDREKSIEAGASDYVTKPVDTVHLLTVMRGWLDADSGIPTAPGGTQA